MVASSHTHVVLLVDDYADTREAIGVYLSGLRLQVVESPSGTDALRRLNEGLEPCVLILDAQMPDVSGWDVLRELHEGGMTVPTVMLSGYPEHAGLALRLGARAYITKPPDLDTIAAVIEEHCQRRDP